MGVAKYLNALYYHDMTAEIPSDYRHEHEEDGIRRRLQAFAPQLESHLLSDKRGPMHYINGLGRELRQTASLRTMSEILPHLGQPELRHYNRLKGSPGAIGSLLGIEVARQTLGSIWDGELADTLSSLLDDLEPTSTRPSLAEVLEQRDKFLTACEDGWEYGAAYKPIFDRFMRSGEEPIGPHSQIEEASDAFGFVLYATVITLKCVRGRVMLNAQLDPEFTSAAYRFFDHPGLWDVAIRKFFEET